jgi:hypothetical protein
MTRPAGFCLTASRQFPAGLSFFKLFWLLASCQFWLKVAKTLAMQVYVDPQYCAVLILRISLPVRRCQSCGFLFVERTAAIVI